ncbi:hypothetical protein P175DRAFT_0502801 [Aspergillus ochraceoroseus IBT 24754]|uniref:Uncharacterized protein n=1 Tax=Aspergillus ochraceoroseus IBT 24754 TaxID=1392256 RepID=A0A2T5LSM4_9EURO|nr:uncharacterized protein P175DRAFT_0502801 [Aspergillus ochraceoroseus IBT 24754]PTU19276.1 hypothetical protein P175DRAFT_0502801 [Aspergillus ochraceoroseus IBT 24754]
MTSPHNPLISALTTLYTLLVDLRYIPASTLVLPSSQTRRHPRNCINRSAAAQNGFSEEVIELAYQIPYIADEDYQVNYDTQPLCYLARVPEVSGEDNDKNNEPEEIEGEDAWEFARDPTFQDRLDLWTGHNILVLTRGGLYGVELIYDLDKQTITEWQPFETPETWRSLPAIPMTSSQNPLYVWIRAFLALQNIPLDDDILIPREPEELGYPGDNASEGKMREWRERVEDAEKERGLKDVYVGCGWKTDTVDRVEDDAQLPIWEALEQARRRAGEEFRGEEFGERKEAWKGSL